MNTTTARKVTGADVYASGQAAGEFLDAAGNVLGTWKGLGYGKVEVAGTVYKTMKAAALSVAR